MPRRVAGNSHFQMFAKPMKDSTNKSMNLGISSLDNIFLKCIPVLLNVNKCSTANGFYDELDSRCFVFKFKSFLTTDLLRNFNILIMYIISQHFQKCLIVEPHPTPLLLKAHTGVLVGEQLSQKSNMLGCSPKLWCLCRQVPLTFSPAPHICFKIII